MEEKRLKPKGINGGDLDNTAVITSDGRYVKTTVNESAEPFIEIIIQVGEVKRNDLYPVRVWVNGERIEHLRGFEFSAHVDKAESPIMKIEKFAY